MMLHSSVLPGRQSHLSQTQDSCGVEELQHALALISVACLISILFIREEKVHERNS